jgi:hypothetical protein
MDRRLTGHVSHCLQGISYAGRAGGKWVIAARRGVAVPEGCVGFDGGKKRLSPGRVVGGNVAAQPFLVEVQFSSFPPPDRPASLRAASDALSCCRPSRRCQPRSRRVSVF